MYYSIYSVFTYNLMFYLGMDRREWMDGVGWVWMTFSQLGKCSQLGLGFSAGLAGLGFPDKKVCIIVDSVYLQLFLHLKTVRGGKNRWTELGDVFILS
jgi:hypothetical protein